MFIHVQQSPLLFQGQTFSETDAILKYKYCSYKVSDSVTVNSDIMNFDLQEDTFFFSSNLNIYKMIENSQHAIFFDVVTDCTDKNSTIQYMLSFDGWFRNKGVVKMQTLW